MDVFKLSYVLPHYFHYNRYFLFDMLYQLNIGGIGLVLKIGQFEMHLLVPQQGQGIF